MRRPGSTVVYLLIYLVLAETSSLVVLDKGTRLTSGVSGSLKPLTATATAEEAIRPVRVLELPRTRPQCPVAVTGERMRRDAMCSLKMSLALHAGSRVDQFQLDFLKERVPLCLLVVIDIVGVLTQTVQHAGRMLYH